jgi:ASC-1-like (ASCH) protein/ribosomal protein S18 acetylase RimI-like enzyme
VKKIKKKTMQIRQITTGPYRFAVERFFNEVIEPIYGDQTSALRKIFPDKDRTSDRQCDGLFDGERLLGIILYKTELQGKRKSVELKTLGLLRPGESSGKGLGTELVKHLLSVVDRLHARGVKVTVSSANLASKSFFEKFAFKVEHEANKESGDKQAELFMYVKAKNLSKAYSDLLARRQSRMSNSAEDQAERSGITQEPTGNRNRKRKAEPDKFSGEHSVSGDKKHLKGSSGSREGSAAQTGLFNSSGSVRMPPPPPGRPPQQDPSPRRYSSIPGVLSRPRYSSIPHRDSGPRSTSSRHQATNSRQPSSGNYRTCTLMKKYVQLIQSGKKSYEARCGTKMFQNYRQGDTVKWFAGSVADVTTKIVAVERFKSWEEMLRTNGYEGYVPDARNLQHAIQVYNAIPGYREKAERFGVLSFKLEVINRPESSHSMANTSYRRW